MQNDAFESDDETPIQAAIHKSVQDAAKHPQGSGTASKQDKTNTSTTNSKFATIGALPKDQSSSDEEGSFNRLNSLGNNEMSREIFFRF